MHKNISKYKLIFLFLGVVLLFPKSSSFAKEPSPVPPPMIKVSPVIYNINLTPGKEDVYELKIENLLSVPLGIKADLESLDAINEETGIQFEAPKPNAPFLSWIELPEITFIVPPKETKTIKININAPKTAKDGGYYGILFLTPFVSKPIDKLSPTVLSRIGVLLLANLGEQKTAKPEEKAKIVELRFDKIFENSPSQIILRVQNTYSYHFSAKPKIEILPFFGKEKIIELEEKRILPQKIRKWQEDLNLGVGIYKARLSVSLGNGEQIFKTTYFVVLPIRNIVKYLILGLFLLFLIIGRKRIIKAGIEFSKQTH